MTVIFSHADHPPLEEIEKFVRHCLSVHNVYHCIETRAMLQTFDNALLRIVQLSCRAVFKRCVKNYSIVVKHFML